MLQGHHPIEMEIFEITAKLFLLQPFTASDYPIGIFDLRRLITPLVSSDCFMHGLLNVYQHNKMRKELDCDYDKWNITVVICDTDIP
jgi:hypothetical protein